MPVPWTIHLSTLILGISIWPMAAPGSGPGPGAGAGVAMTGMSVAGTVVVVACAAPTGRCP